MDELLARRLRKAFDVEKVDFDAHVCLVPYLARAQFFGLMRQSALLLDTIGFSGFNTALQATEVGLPVLAHEGRFLRGRLASGIMRRMGLPELVSGTDDLFIELAVELATNAERRAELSRTIIQRRGALFMDTKPLRALENCLTEAIEHVSSK